MDKLFEIHNLRCSYDKHYRERVSKTVLHIDDLVLPKGKKIFIVGESGIGKSTILEVLGMMNNTIVPDKDTKFLFYQSEEKPVDLLEMWRRGKDEELSYFRRRNFNFIFQSTNLMRNFTAYENIAITRMIQGYTRFSSFRKVDKILADLGLDHVDESRMAQELSGGQQQRLAFARAVLPDFTVLFGDEPTGNLDSDNAVRAMSLLSGKLNELKNSSAIIVSHDMHLAVTFADIIIKIRKKEHPRKSDADEVTFYGLIDGQSVFVPSEDGESWSNGTESHDPEDFEKFLKRI